MLQMKELNHMNTSLEVRVGTQLNSTGQITITFENQDQFLHLHNSCLLIEGDVLKADIQDTQMLISLQSPIMDCCIFFLA